MAFGAANGLIATMEKTLASGADVNQLTDGFQKMTETDDEGSFDEYAAPLHPAAKNDEYAAAEWLLSHGADVRIRTRDGVRVYSTFRTMRTVLGQLVRARYWVGFAPPSGFPYLATTTTWSEGLPALFRCHPWLTFENSQPRTALVPFSTTRPGSSGFS